jgi:hypothetical protein
MIRFNPNFFIEGLTLGVIARTPTGRDAQANTTLCLLF